jgi:hypothetical protein
MLVNLGLYFLGIEPLDFHPLVHDPKVLVAQHAIHASP